MSFFYLATPYSNFPRGLDAAADAADREAGFLIASGIHVMSPIAHCHRLFKSGYSAGGDWATWAEWNRAMIAASAGVLVSALDGWGQSVGVQNEIAFCRAIGKAHEIVEPGCLPSLLGKP